MPLWVPLPQYAGFSSRDSSAARAAGLVTRPLEATLEDVLAWELGRDPPTSRQVGLFDRDARDLLDEIAATKFDMFDGCLSVGGSGGALNPGTRRAPDPRGQWLWRQRHLNSVFPASHTQVGWPAPSTWACG